MKTKTSTVQPRCFAALALSLLLLCSSCSTQIVPRDTKTIKAQPAKKPLKKKKAISRGEATIMLVMVYIFFKEGTDYLD
jgi:hypothetical protein